MRKERRAGGRHPEEDGQSLVACVKRRSDKQIQSYEAVVVAKLLGHEHDTLPGAFISQHGNHCGEARAATRPTRGFCCTDC